MTTTPFNCRDGISTGSTPILISDVSGNLTGASLSVTGNASAVNITASGTLNAGASTLASILSTSNNLTVGNVTTPTDTTAIGGGLTLRGVTNKTLTWNSAVNGWESSENFNIATGLSYKIAGTSVLNSTTLGTGVINSSLTSVGTITTGNWNASLISPQFGGTGVNNAAKTITLGGNLITSGAFNTTLTATNTTTVTLPTSGTLSTLAGSEVLTNKTFSLANNTFTGTSAQLLAGISDETGTGSLVFSSSPTLVTPNIGAASASSLSVSGNISGTWTGGIIPVTLGGTGASSATAALANIMPSGTTAGYVLTTSGAGSYYWAASAGSGSQVGTRINSARTSTTATTSQTAFPAPTYVTGSNQLRVYINGVRQYSGDYAETSTTSFTLNTGASLNDVVLAEVDGYVSFPLTAISTSFTPVGSIVATDVQNAIAALDTSKAAKTDTTYIGTTSIALNRTSASQTLAGVSIDGNSATSTTVTGSIGSAVTATTQIVGTNTTQIATTAFVLANIPPATVAIPTITATVAANALTIGVSAQSLSFRSATAGSGAITTIAATPTSLVVPAGATLGTIAATSARLVILELLNAGVAELAIVNLAGGNQLDETNLITTTAISASATAANVIYSTTARTSVPYRVIGFIDITEATAGTWATAPSTIQGCGGQALAAMSSLGYGQTWQAFTSVTRALGTTYYNTTGKPIFANVTVSSGSSIGATLTVNGTQVTIVSVNSSTNGYLSFIVPAGQSYVINTTATLATWSELR